MGIFLQDGATWICWMDEAFTYRDVDVDDVMAWVLAVRVLED